MRWPIAYDARHKVRAAGSHKRLRTRPFLAWLDEYFRHTPEERMRDPYIAYWR
jgi:hypothetical protein